MYYPKINSLWKRDQSKEKKLIIGEYARPEFESIKYWTVDEKVDGTNIRITFERTPDYPSGRITFGGRTANSQIPCALLERLQQRFCASKMDSVFKDSNFVVLFGEGYGAKIQNGGSYRKDPDFILFDAYISGWWCERSTVQNIAIELGLDFVPEIDPVHGGILLERRGFFTQFIIDYITSKPKSILAKDEYEMEGVMCRSYPLMLFRNGEPIQFKLKCKDF